MPMFWNGHINTPQFNTMSEFPISNQSKLSCIEQAVLQCIRREESVIYIDTNCNISDNVHIDYKSIAYENEYDYREINCFDMHQLEEDLSDEEIVNFKNRKSLVYMQLSLRRASDMHSEHPRAEVEWVEKNIKNIRNRLLYELEYADKYIDFKFPVNIITDNFCILNWSLDDRAGQYADMTNMRRRRNIRCISCF